MLFYNCQTEMIWELFSCEDNYELFCRTILRATILHLGIQITVYEIFFRKFLLNSELDLSFMRSDMSLSFKSCWSHLCDFDIKRVNAALVPVFFKLLFSFFFKDLQEFIIAPVWRLFVCRNKLFLKIDLSSREVGAWCSVLLAIANKSRFKHIKNCDMWENQFCKLSDHFT